MFPLRATNIVDNQLTQFARFPESAILIAHHAFQFLQCQEIKHISSMAESFNQLISLSSVQLQYKQ